MTSFAQIVAWVEEEISRYYRFDANTSAVDHLVSAEDLKSVLGKDAEERAGVYLTEADGDIFLGVHFASDIIQSLQDQDPRRGLSNSNLDGFCMVVEEVSHFHLLLHRMHKNISVSRLELESLGEIDKVLISYIALQKQQANCQLLPLVRMIYDGSRIVATESQKHLYEQASAVAARFWFRAVEQGLDPFGELRDYLVTAYRHHDLTTVNALDIKRAA